MLCPYCQTEQKQEKICSFCKADLTQDRPKMKQTLSEEEAYQSQPVLTTYHTYDLMVLLQHIRKERSFYYHNMQIVRKAPFEANVPEEINQEGQRIYREHTAQMRVIESILIDRMGYYPKRIDNKLLEALKNKIRRSNSNQPKK